MNNHSTPTTTAAREYAKLAGISAGALIIVSLPLSLAGAVVASALGWNATLIGGSIVAAAIVIATLLGLDALRVARGMFVDQIATYLSKTKAEAKKIEAEADRILAEADRIDAESQALTRASETAAQVNVNSGSGKMKVTNPFNTM
jgi:hypothetical protein